MLKLLEKAHQFKARQDDHTRAVRSILEKDFTEEELSQYVSLFDDWEEVPEGEYIEESTYLQCDKSLYQCLPDKGHNKKRHLHPKVATTVFKSVCPDATILEWSPEEIYNLNDEVTYKGSVWRSCQDGLFTEPGTDDTWEMIDITCKEGL